MILRKVTTLDETWDFPWSLLEEQSDGYIITVSEVYDELTDVYSIPEVGIPVTWLDINNVMYFDFRIGDNIYSWTSKPGCIKVGIDSDNSIGIVQYRPFKLNNQVSNIKRVVSPKFTPIKCTNGRFTINGVCTPSTEFIDATTFEYKTMNDIILIDINGNEKHLMWDVIEDGS